MKESSMQNVNSYIPGSRHHWWVSPSGVITNSYETSASKIMLLNSSGYTGARPAKPRPVHSYSFNRQEITGNQDFGDIYYSDGSTEHGRGPILIASPDGAIYPTVSVDDIYNLALERLNDKIRGGLDLSVDVAQSGQTAKMLRVTDQLVDYTKTYTRRFGVAKAASKAWLTYIYGVKPLVQSIYGAADESLRMVINKLERHTGRATKKLTPDWVKIPTMWGPLQCPIMSGVVKHSCTIGLTIEPKEFDLSRWTSLNPVSILWELMPHSFVFDWVYNVGGYIRAMETSLLYASQFRGGYVTFLSASDTNWRLTSKADNASYRYYNELNGNVRHLSINRTVLGEYPEPRRPSFKAELGSSRLISAAALLAQLLGRR